MHTKNQKGGADHVSSGTTSPPTLSSMHNRNECTRGVVLHIYWKFVEAGDNYLVHILAGLDPCSADFGVPPPHFTVPYDDPHVQEYLDFFWKNN